MTPKCEICGQFFEITTWPPESQKTCSPRCRNTYNSRQSIEKRAAKMRYTGNKDTYVKRGGRHEHRVVAEEEILGRKLKDNEIVHHKNGDKKDNRPENLEVMTQSEHIHEHIDLFETKYEGCKVETCDNDHYCKGYCTSHHSRYWKYDGDVFPEIPLDKSHGPKTLPEVREEMRGDAQ